MIDGPNSRARPEGYLVVDHGSFGYGAQIVVRDVSVRVGLGETVVIMGPNGAGKTTLVKGIIGQLGPGSGEVRLGGVEISRLRHDERIRLGIGYVPQIKDVFPTLSVWENLQMGGYLSHSSAARAALAEVFELFPSLAEMKRRRAGTLSGGERKMLGIARALMGHPKLLVIDEPTAHLAPLIAAQVLHTIVRNLASSGRAVLMIEQRVEMALEIASWGYVLMQGGIRLDADAMTLRQSQQLGELFFATERSEAPDLTVSD